MATGLDKFNNAVMIFMVVAGCANIERDVPPEGQDGGVTCTDEACPGLPLDAVPEIPSEPDAPVCNPNYGCYGTCIEDHDCGHNAVCRDHQCRDFCECDEDCENGMSCRSGACRPL